MMMMIEVMLLVMIIYCVFFFISMSSDKSDSMLSSYECGFDPGMGARVSFSYRFFLISILFLVFDVEVTLMIPIPFMEDGSVQVFGVWYFVFILITGLLYEYYNGVLGWLKVENF